MIKIQENKSLAIKAFIEAKNHLWPRDYEKLSKLSIGELIKLLEKEDGE